MSLRSLVTIRGGIWQTQDPKGGALSLRPQAGDFVGHHYYADDELIDYIWTGEGWQSSLTTVDEVLGDVQALAERQTFTLQRALSDGVHTVMYPSEHPRLNVLDAWATLGDNIDAAVEIKILGITDTVRFSDTEKAGKTKKFTVIAKEYIGFWKNVDVHVKGPRTVLVNLALRSAE